MSGNYQPGTRDSGSGRRARLAFVGDICLAKGVSGLLRQFGARYPFEHVSALLQGADVAIGNLECWLTDREPVNSMAVPAELAAGLGPAGFHVMSLANNHTMDGGETGLVATQKFLDSAGVGYFGAGADRARAEAPLIHEVPGARIGILGACDVARVYAARGRAGVAPLHWQRLAEQVRHLKRDVDITVVCLHADLEFSHHPSPARIRGCRRLVEAGADLVIQHHSHVCQGVEFYRGGLIAYSLGNFVFNVHDNPYLRGRPGCDWGAILFVDVAPGSGQRLSWSLQPITIDATHRPIPSDGEVLARQLEQLDRFSRELSRPAVIRRQWLSRCRAEAKLTAYSIFHQARKEGLMTAMRNALKLPASRHERRWMLGLLTGGRLG